MLCNRCQAGDPHRRTRGVLGHWDRWLVEVSSIAELHSTFCAGSCRWLLALTSWVADQGSSSDLSSQVKHLFVEDVWPVSLSPPRNWMVYCKSSAPFQKNQHFVASNRYPNDMSHTYQLRPGVIFSHCEPRMKTTWHVFARRFNRFLALFLSSTWQLGFSSGIYPDLLNEPSNIGKEWRWNTGPLGLNSW